MITRFFKNESSVEKHISCIAIRYPLCYKLHLDQIWKMIRPKENKRKAENKCDITQPIYVKCELLVTCNHLLLNRMQSGLSGPTKDFCLPAVGGIG